MSLEAGILASGMEFEPQGWVLCLEIVILAWRLELEPERWDLSPKGTLRRIHFFSCRDPEEGSDFFILM